MKTGAGAALLKDPDTAVAVARAAARGLRAARSRSSCAPRAIDVARRLVEEAGVAGITFHPRTVKVHHKGRPTTSWPPRLVQELPGAGDRLRRHARGRPHPLGVRVHGLRGGHARARRARQPVAVRGGARRPRRGARAATRSSTSGCGCSTAPWSTSARTARPRYLRKFHPWYVERLGGAREVAGRPAAGRHVAEQRALIAGLRTGFSPVTGATMPPCAAPAGRTPVRSYSGLFLSPDPTQDDEHAEGRHPHS